MSLEDDINLLSRVRMFSDFGAEHLRLIAFGSQKMSFLKGYELFRDGQSTDGGYVIVSGGIELISFQEEYPRILKKFTTASLLGEMALISINRRIGTAIVSEDCELMKISRTTMHRILNEYPQLAVMLQKRISSSVMSFAKDLEKIKL